jgi:hypothetical protein
MCSQFSLKVFTKGMCADVFEIFQCSVNFVEEIGYQVFACFFTINHQFKRFFHYTALDAPSGDFVDKIV